MLLKLKKLLIDKIFSICFKNGLVFFILISLPIIFITVYSYSFVNRSLTKFTNNTFLQIAATSSVALDEKLNGLTTLGLSFATNPIFRKNVNEGRWEEAALITDVFKNVNDEQFIDLIFLTDTQGSIKSSSPRMKPFEGSAGVDATFFTS